MSDEQWLLQVLVEFVIFYAVHLIGDSIDSGDKQLILMLECALLLVSNYIVTVWSHIPFLLFGIMCFTLFYLLFPVLIPEYRRHSDSENLNCAPSNGDQKSEDEKIHHYLRTESTAKGENAELGKTEADKSSEKELKLRFLEYDGSHPPGISTSSSLSCLSSVLQIISRTPNLGVYFDNAIDQGICVPLTIQERTFLAELYKIFRLLVNTDLEVNVFNIPCFYKCPVDISNLVSAINLLDASVLDLQTRQTAGKLLNNLLDCINELLLTNSHLQTIQESLDKLMTRCNIPSFACIQIRQQQCRLQVSLAKGRQDRSYLWPTLMLLNLNWIDYMNLCGQNRHYCYFCNSATLSVNQTGNTLLLSPKMPIFTDGQKRMVYRQLPDCLVIQLQKFNSNLTKLLQRIEVSAKPIDLSFLETIIVGESRVASKYYSLYGICLHFGDEDISSGHYCSFSLMDDGKWFFIDDSRVKRILDINQELADRAIQESVYLLFYSRVY